ncbi:MAG: c-type cytochrome [Betaproteobacteria bacterium]|nr:c-type cytochrome [Betaproteobacteria bacterium]
MPKRSIPRAALLAALVLLPAAAWLAPVENVPLEALTGGDLSVADASQTAYLHPAAGLDSRQNELFALGRRMFQNRWAFFWFENAEFGRGPTSNAQACATCHTNNGRGLVTGTPSLPTVAMPGEVRDHHITVPFEPAPNLVVRVSLPGVDAHGGPRLHPQYGDQLQIFGVKGVVPPEASFGVEWTEHEVALAEGETRVLRKPLLRLSDFGYGPLGEDAHVGMRMAPPLVGLGLLEAVPDETLLALAARPATGDIRGKVNRVWDESQRKVVIGRFGLKANHGSLREQVAIAFLNDIGLSTEVYPDQNCPPMSPTCKEQMVAGKPEITALRLAATELYVRSLRVPVRRQVDDPQVREGDRLFADAQCAVCHVPELRTGPFPAFPPVAHQTIRPFTDLLLHDMGEDLADGRPDFLASGREWRTPPLWGIGLSEVVNGAGAFLHDGRARNLEEAILWHGGEAKTSRDAFAGMRRGDREALIAFLKSL